ncbi:MAG: oligoendopeptidase F [Spirochaetae bacterium HGW-Spirochaetae-1]|jgi:oligoendopeptidase F|nr:MAG: oligoendopeptidase F [Spirochaetae bacterium HGW-Spirochaetae-1]
MAEKIKDRINIPKEHQWDLTPLFKNDEEWEALFSELENTISGYNQYRGKLHESVATFKEALEFDLSVSRKLERLYTYAHLKSDEDKTNQQYQALYQRSMNLYTRISETASFLTPEIQSIPDETMKAYREHESMQEYAFFLEKILRYKLHTLSQEIEEILAMSGEVAQASSQVFSQLDNADLKFGTITDGKGREVELSHGNFSSFLIDPSRELRKKAFFQYYEAYENHKNTMAATLGFSNKKDHFYSRVRKFDNSRHPSLFSDNMPESVYDNLIATVKKNLGPLFDYLAFRKEALELDDLHFYDTYVPIVPDMDFHMTYEEAVDTCVEALRPLGEEYCSELRSGLLGGWVDRYENRGKRSGAYSSGCYDSPPYILMNYRDDNINSLYTLIHEAGHSMHSLHSRKGQSYIYHDYTIFVAEVASTFNETLLSHYLLEKYRDDPRMRAYILNREIDNIRATLYRQTMFAEFEKESHAIIEANDPLTLETITSIYNRLLREYFGGAMVLDNVLDLECLRIPHFYSAFYVYKYATGISAAIALAEKVLKEGAPARQAYMTFLSLGGSKFPLDELRQAGVDMGSPEPVQYAIDHFAALVQELKKALQR